MHRRTADRPFNHGSVRSLAAPTDLTNAFQEQSGRRVPVAEIDDAGQRGISDRLRHPRDPARAVRTVAISIFRRSMSTRASHIARRRAINIGERKWHVGRVLPGKILFGPRRSSSDCHRHVLLLFAPDRPCVYEVIHDESGTMFQALGASISSDSQIKPTPRTRLEAPAVLK